MAYSQNETGKAPFSTDFVYTFLSSFRRDSCLRLYAPCFGMYGGVLLTNAWDRTERAKALEHFHVDPDEFHSRHEMLVSSFERGKITLDDYLERTIFYRERSFAIAEFRDYMFTLSEPFPEVLKFAQALSSSNKYFMGTINNESRELNDYRIEKFGLEEIFRVFVSSCFVGLRKPERDIYRLALETTQIARRPILFHRRSSTQSGERRKDGNAHDRDEERRSTSLRVGKAGSFPVSLKIRESCELQPSSPRHSPGYRIPGSST